MLILAGCFSIKSQEVNAFLQNVAENNPEIKAYTRLLEARKFDARTGLAPPDPSVSFGYMPDQTDNNSIKKTWSVMQSFSFPTKYITQKNISRGKIVLAEQEFSLARLNILLNAKILVFDMIFNQKQLDILRQRKELYNRLKSGWKKMLDAGETTILDYNKILYEFSALNLRISQTETNIAVLREKLIYQSGNSADVLSFSDYPVTIDRGIENIISEKSAIHPSFLLPEEEYNISLEEVKLSKSGSLPEFQAGYASEIVPGESFTGPVAGLTIPIWSNSKKIKTAKAMADHYAASRDFKLLELKTKIKSEYENMMAIQKSIEELRELRSADQNNLYIEKAFSSGEISLTNYFLYLEASNLVEDRFLELENEFHKLLASLYDHELLQNPVN